MLFFQTKSYLSLCVLTFLALGSQSFADDSRNVFLSWLAAEDKPFSNEIINRTNQKFRERFGFVQSRYSDRSKGEWSPTFLALAEKSFEEKTGKTISDFCNLTNNQMKDGISSSISRFSSLEGQRYSPLYSEYLAANLKLAKNGKELSTSESNKEIWKNHIRVGALESMGGNAGAGAHAVNFLFDKKGKIVFVGNIQDALPDIQQQAHNNRLSSGTVRYAVDSKIWQLFTPNSLSPELKAQLTQDLTDFHGTAPIPSNQAFQLQCDLALKKLLGR